MAQRHHKKRQQARGLLRDPRYLDFCARYQGNLVGYILDHSRHRLTWQQLDVAMAAQAGGARGGGCLRPWHRQKLADGMAS